MKTEDILIRLVPLFIKQRLENKNNLVKIITNTGWLFADRILRMGIGLFVGLLVARYLGPEQFGIYNYAIAFVALSGTLATLGLDSIVIRDIVNEPACKDKTLGSAFVMKLIGGLSTLVMSILFVSLIQPEDILTLILVSIIATGLVFQSFDVIDFWFQSQIKSKYTVYAKNSAFLFISIVKIGLIHYQAPLVAFALAGLAEILMGAMGLIIVYQKNNTIKDWQFSLDRAKDLIKESWPLILTGVVITIYMKIDMVMLGLMIDSSEVGYYTIAVQLSEVWYFIPSIVLISLYPSFVKIYNENEKLYTQRLQEVMGYFFWGSLILSLILIFAADKIIYILYGPSYLPAANILKIHILSSIVVNMSVIFSHRYTLNKTLKISFYGAFIGAITNVALNMWLIPSYAGVGAAIATVISYITPIIVQTIFFDRSIGAIFVRSIFMILRKR
jgi:PST family polysaccharide transporter